MAKLSGLDELTLASPAAGVDLWRWLYEGLRAAIADGRLRPNTKLPSTRNLAVQYGISRGTVTLAFERLLSEGYLRAEVGSGTFVAFRQPRPRRNRAAEEAPRQITQRAARCLPGVEVIPAPRSVAGAFRAFEPAIDLFPADSWARTASKVLRRGPRSLYGHGDAAGYAPLRRAVAEYAGPSRGVRCSPEQVLITCGTQQAVDLIGRLLIEPGDEACVEDPGYPAVHHALRNHGATVIPAPVDDSGLDVKAAEAMAPRARLVYVTPANQFPLGVTMTGERRAQLLAWAKRRGAWIIEDDYDAEYRYTGHPVASLQSTDTGGSVIYAGTFTKMLFNAIRLGFLILPENLVDPFERMRSLMDRHPPTLEQAILAEFISEGHFGRHVRAMREVYGERMEVLRAASRQHLTGLIDVVPANAGMRTIGWLRPGPSDEQVAKCATEAGLEVLPVSRFTARVALPPGLILGFAAVPPAELRRGAVILSGVLSAMTARGGDGGQQFSRADRVHRS